MKELLLFQVGTMQFGIDLRRISTIQPMKPIVAEQPQGGHRIIQIGNGQKTELYDLLSFFDQEAPPSASESRKVIMVEVDGNPMGMIVDHVDRVVSVDNNRIELLSSIFKGPSMLCFPGVLKYEDRLFLLLNPDGIVSVERHQTEFTGTAVKAPDRVEHQLKRQHSVEGDDIEQSMSISEDSSSWIKTQPLPADLNE